MSKPGIQGIQPQVFDRSASFSGWTELTSALGLPHILPVGGLVASAGEALGVDEGFHQNGTIGIALLPVIR